MIRKLAFFASAAVLASSAFVASSAPAASTTYNTTAASVTCNTFIGSASIKPPLGGTPVPTKITLKGTLTGCAAVGATPASPALSVVSGSVSGTLSNATGSCAGLLGPSTQAGTLTVKWKVGSGQKLDSSSTVLTPNVFTGTLLVPGGAFGGAAYGEFIVNGASVPPATASGAFGGGAPSVAAATSQDVGALGAACAGAGVKTINIGLGSVTL